MRICGGSSLYRSDTTALEDAGQEIWIGSHSRGCLTTIYLQVSQLPLVQTDRSWAPSQ